MLKPEFTVEDGTNLIKLIDVAIKAGGLDCAIVATPLAKKIRDAYEQHQKEQAEQAQREAFARFEAEKAPT